MRVLLRRFVTGPCWGCAFVCGSLGKSQFWCLLMLRGSFCELSKFAFVEDFGRFLHVRVRLGGNLAFFLFSPVLWAVFLQWWLGMGLLCPLPVGPLPGTDRQCPTCVSPLFDPILEIALAIFIGFPCGLDFMPSHVWSPGWCSVHTRFLIAVLALWPCSPGCLPFFDCLFYFHALCSG